uniref:Uncharacterized protein n=1 Tax=Panagrellus redivivus TaxID=6233 RepID=A0A7E4W0V7_PANRE
MFFRTALVYFSFFLNQVSAELVLEKDVNEIVTFDGSELQIEVDNSRGIDGDFTLCIKATTQASQDCPTGYDRIHFAFGHNAKVKTATMNRQGKVMLDSSEYVTIQSVVFNEDGILELILKEVPDQSTIVRLLNAVRHVPPESQETTTPKKSDSMAMFSVVVIVLLVVAGFVSVATLAPEVAQKSGTIAHYKFLIAGLIATICYCRRGTPQKMEHSDDRGQKHKILKNDRAPAPPNPKSRRTSSTTFNSSMTNVKPTSSPNTKPIPLVSPFDNTFLTDSTKESASFKGVSALRRPSSQCK